MFREPNKMTFLFFSLALAFLTTGRKSHAEDAVNACASVTCSNHGVCVIKNGEPVCACDEGYVPDATVGLSCQPVTTYAGPAPSLTFAQEQKEIQTALHMKTPPEEGYCLRYKVQFPHRHCAHYWYDYYNRKKAGSLLFLIPGILGMGAGAVMGIMVDPVAGVGIGGAAIILTTVGALMLAKNVRRAKSLYPLVMKYSDNRHGVSRVTVIRPRFNWQGTTFSVQF